MKIIQTIFPLENRLVFLNGAEAPDSIGGLIEDHEVQQEKLQYPDLNEIKEQVQNKTWTGENSIADKYWEEMEKKNTDLFKKLDVTDLKLAEQEGVLNEKGQGLVYLLKENFGLTDHKMQFLACVHLKTELGVDIDSISRDAKISVKRGDDGKFKITIGDKGPFDMFPEHAYKGLAGRQAEVQAEISKLPPEKQEAIREIPAGSVMEMFNRRLELDSAGYMVGDVSFKNEEVGGDFATLDCNVQDNPCFRFDSDNDNWSIMVEAQNPQKFTLLEKSDIGIVQRVSSDKLDDLAKYISSAKATEVVVATPDSAPAQADEADVAAATGSQDGVVLGEPRMGGR
ncbi:MAG: hypothetical protein N4A36_03655 [Candidatus Gracilibacteria bacterium]|jgi:hypothetical protein|nr:hypothetical protein [Candidatus Gracilibacteria bacterium]